MARITTEDIMILIMIIAIVEIGLWMLVGSSSKMQAIIAITMFFGTAGLFILKINLKLSKSDKNTSISFLNVKHEKNHLEVTNRLNNINSELDKIERKIK